MDMHEASVEDGPLYLGLRLGDHGGGGERGNFSLEFRVGLCLGAPPPNLLPCGPNCHEPTRMSSPEAHARGPR
jgi:hypothetical protein